MVALPATIADCLESPRLEDGQWVGGICPVLRCRWNLLLDVTEHGSIAVGGKGGKGNGATLYNDGRRITSQHIDDFADAVVEMADRLPSTCTWDYVRQPGLIPSRGTYRDRAVAVFGSDFKFILAAMTLQQMGDIFGVTREAMRMADIKALRKARRAEGSAELDPGFVPAKRLVRR